MAMAPDDELRPCPFCAHDRPALVMAGEDRVRIVLVTCPECGALGPPARGDNPPGTAEHLWNSRYGVQ